MEGSRAALAERIFIPASGNEWQFVKGCLQLLACGLMLLVSAAPAASAATIQPCRGVQDLNQPEARDAAGRVTVEAALIHVVNCNQRQFYIYQYRNRPGFRVILPPDYGHAIGGREFPTYTDAVAAAFAASNTTATGATPNRGGSVAAPAKAIAWQDYPLVAARGYDKDGQRSTYTCPPNGRPFAVTGTNTYTDDSSVCTAAVHAGLISFAAGGIVTVEVRRPGSNRYQGSSRNGVTSRDYDNGPNPTLGAFIFVR